MKFDLLDNSLSDAIQLGTRHKCFGPLLAMFGYEAAGSAVASEVGAGALAESWGAATVAEGVGTQAAVESAQAAAAAQTAATSGITAGEALTYAYMGATLLKGISGYQSGAANAAYLNESGRQARMVGAANKNLADARGRAQLGEIRAQVGAQGSTFSGSPMLVYLDSVRNAAIESATEYYKGSIGEAGYKEQARWAKRGGEADLWSGIIGASAPAMKSLGSRLLA